MVAFRTGSVLLATACALASLSSSAQAFYIPGFSPNIFKLDDRVPLYVNKIFSKKSPLPYAYADLPFVCPSTHAKNEWLNLGEVLRGDRISTSDYEVLSLFWLLQCIRVKSVVGLGLGCNCWILVRLKLIMYIFFVSFYFYRSSLCFFSLWWARTSSARCCAHEMSPRRKRHSPKSSSPTTTTWNGMKEATHHIDQE